MKSNKVMIAQIKKNCYNKEEVKYMKFIEFTDTEIKEFDELNRLGYVFDWTKKSSRISMTVGLITNGDIAGLVEFERRAEHLYNYMWLIEVADSYKGTSIAGMLLAYVGRDSLQQGFEGFVMFEPKTALYDYYIEKYGAKPLTGRRLVFDTAATKKLIDRFLIDRGELE
jgi:hypothetical protein